MKSIKGTTRIGGLIGRGISYSLSPLIHNTAAEILGLDAVYLPFDLAEAPTPAFFETMLHANCYGFNITVPYKESIARLFRFNSSVMSCNTLIAKKDHWEIASTDAAGFFKGLGEIEKAAEDFSSIICLGYGGAAKALISHIQELYPTLPLFVLKRKAVTEEDDVRLQFFPFENAALKALLEKFPNSLVIQCTNLKGDALAEFSLKGLTGAFVDLVYGSPSCLLQDAKDRGIPCQDGIPMLIHQALLAQQLWWGQTASFSDMKAAIMRQK